MRSAIRTIVLASFLLGCSPNEFSAEQSAFFVRRNLFGGAEGFPVAKARSFQYGSIHVDGPSGGMLYRFETTDLAVAWLIDRWQLRKVPDRESPLPDVESPPRWWRPVRSPLESYAVIQELEGGGTRVMTLVITESPREVFVADHYRRFSSV